MSLPNEVNLHHLGSTGYNINQSLRIQQSQSAYLTRTPASNGNRQLCTFSFWIKRGILGSGDIFSSGNSGGGGDAISFNSDDTLAMFLTGGGSGYVSTTQKFRDVSAWYHIVVAYDTTQATTSNRVKLYVNGSQVTAFATSTWPTLNKSFDYLNCASQAQLFGRGYSYLDFYLTEVNFIDGAQLTPSSFGETDSQTGVWKPKKYGGTYGANGYYLNFADNSAVTAAALGKDSSGNGNNFTPTNVSLTADYTYDWMRDSPTSGTLASNYAVLNNLVPGAAVINGGLRRNSSSGRTSCSTMPLTNGKYYFETRIQDANSNGGVGVKQATAHPLGDYDTSKCATYFANGEYKIEGATQTSGFSSFTNGDLIGIAVDTTQSPAKIWFAKNNTWQGTGNPTTAGYSLTSGFEYLFMVLHGSGSSSTTAAVNFGQQPWAYTPPTGYSALNTYNLPTPTIGATSATQASKYFNIGLWTSNSSASNIPVTGLGFQPSFFWGKLRGSNTNHRLVDAIRGVTKMVNSNTLVAESTETDAFASFDSDGFTIGQDTTGGGLNFSSSSGIGWCWNGGSSTVTNNNGSISSQVRANPTAGFSVVSYTLNNSTFTVGHGLNAAPNFMLVKGRDASNNWDVYHSSVGAGYRLILNDGSNPSASSLVWNNTAPTSTVFSGDSSWWNNPSTNKLIAYCWTAIPGYSAFGLYTGNGASDGTFVYTGFRPKYVLVKATNMTGTRWELFDTTRSTNNPSYSRLSPSESAPEVTDYGSPDILSNGFKFRGAAGYTNDSGTTYIYAAFAESPFKYALAR